MLDTAWKLTLKNAASTPARKITRDILALNSALGRLAASSSSAQAVLSRVAPAGTAGQIRGVTAAIREQTRALREQGIVAGRRAPGTRRAPAATPSGRVALGNGFAQRALALQFAYRSRQGAAEVQQTQRNRAAELRAHQSYFQRLSRMTQASFRENARLAAQARRDSARSAAAQSRSQGALASSAFSLFGGIASVALGAAAALAGIATGFAGIGLAAAGAVVEVAAFRESSLTALEAVLGSSGAAGRQFRNAITVANQTPLDTQDVIRQTQSFAVAGFGEREIAPLIAASADLGAAFGQRSSEGFALALSQIRATGTLQGQELLQLTNANVSRSAVLDSIARQMNLGQGDVGRRAAMTAISQRRVSSGVGEQAALDAVRGRLDQGGQLGSFARRQSETLTGAISNARNAIFNLLIGIDFANVPGLVAFKNVLLQITSALQSGSPAASALRQGIMGAANALGGLLARAVNPTTIAAGMASIGRGLATVQRFGAMALPIVRAFAAGFGPAFTASIVPLRSLFASLTSGGPTSARTLSLLATSARGLGQVLGFVVGTLVSIVGSITTVATLATAAGAGIMGLVTSLVTTLAGGVRTAFSAIGTHIVGGIVDGIRGGVGSMTSAVTDLGSSAIASIRLALGIHSPSRVFADLVGAQIPAGIAMGVNANSGVANDAVSNIVSPRVPALGGGGPPVSITIEVNGASQPAETARAVRAELEDALGSIFGQWAEATP
jgi:hypothetical protein